MGSQDCDVSQDMVLLSTVFLLNSKVRLGTVTHRTEVCKKSLNPQWNSEWFRFEVCFVSF